MAKAKTILGDIASAIYLIIMVPFLGLLLLADVVSLTRISIVINSGFANTGVMAAVGACLVVVALSFLIPGLRRMYYRLPWLEPLVVLLVIDSLILCCAYEILNYGYQVVDPVRHRAFASLAFIWVIVARIVQCTVLKRRPFVFAGACE